MSCDLEHLMQGWAQSLSQAQSVSQARSPSVASRALRTKPQALDHLPLPGRMGPFLPLLSEPQ